MPRPQLENGYTRLADELLEAFTAHPWGSAVELRLVLALVRLTYGYQRREASIGLARWCRLTGLHERTVRRALQRLVDDKVVSRVRRAGEHGQHRASVWALNKDWTAWVRRAPAPVIDDARDGVPRGAPAGVPTESRAAPAASEPERDELVDQLVKEGYKGLDLVKEMRRRKRERPDSQTQGDSETRTVGVCPGPDDPPDSQTPPVTEGEDSQTPPGGMPGSSGPPNARVWRSPPRSTDTRKDTPPTPPRQAEPTEPATETAPHSGGARRETPSKEGVTQKGEPALPPEQRAEAEKIQAGLDAERERRGLRGKGTKPRAERHVTDTLPPHLRGTDP